MVERVLRLVVSPILGFFATIIGFMSFLEKEQGWEFISAASFILVFALILDAFKHKFKPICLDEE